MKRLNEMNELRDMGLFPLSVHLGATLNIVFTIYLTWIVFHSTGATHSLLLPWAITLPALNVLPVLVLRRIEKPGRAYPVIQEMDFFRDQHRFASWVYAIAAANMFFWIVFSWWVFSMNGGIAALVAVQGISVLVTFVPLWRRFHPSYRSLEPV